MTYSFFRTKIILLYKKLNRLKLDEIFSLELGKIVHKCHSGNLPDNFNRLFTPVNQAHCHANRSATRGAYFWQMAHTKYGKGSLKHPSPKIWDNITPCLHGCSPLTLKQCGDEAFCSSLHVMTDIVVLKHGVPYVNCSPLLFHIAHSSFMIFPSRMAIFLPYFS